MIRHFKTVLIASVACLAMAPHAGAFSLKPSGSRLENGTAARKSPVVLAQASDATARIGRMEEEIRELNGKIEDLGYQMLQMQEQMRQMQKDNEFRFQNLEGGGSSASADGDRSQAEPSASSTDGVDLADGALPGVEGNTTASTGAQPSTNGSGEPPRSLGSLTFDSDGNTVGGSAPLPDEGTFANDSATGSLSGGSDPEGIYQVAYDYILKGDYRSAQSGFKDYLDIYPDGPQAADAAFWLGESEFSQGDFNAAAKAFLDAHKKYPDAEKAPETLLKLGMSLAALDNVDTACATYEEVLKRYPDASSTVRKKVASEESRAGC